MSIDLVVDFVILYITGDRSSGFCLCGLKANYHLVLVVVEEDECYRSLRNCKVPSFNFDKAQNLQHSLALDSTSFSAMTTAFCLVLCHSI